MNGVDLMSLVGLLVSSYQYPGKLSIREIFLSTGLITEHFEN